jgi:hypothetical protein
MSGYAKVEGYVPPTQRWFTTEEVGKLRVGGGFEKIVKKVLILKTILDTTCFDAQLRSELRVQKISLETLFQLLCRFCDQVLAQLSAPWLYAQFFLP